MINEIMEFMDDSLLYTNILWGMLTVVILTVTYEFVKKVVIPMTKRLFESNSLFVRAGTMLLVPMIMLFLLTRAVWVIKMGEPIPHIQLAELAFIVLTLTNFKNAFSEFYVNGFRTLSGRTGETKVIHRIDDQPVSNLN